LCTQALSGHAASAITSGTKSAPSAPRDRLPLKATFGVIPSTTMPHSATVRAGSAALWTRSAERPVT